MSDIEIKDVGPIRNVRIPVDPDGGVVVLRGPNGAGKSIGLQCVAALTTAGGKLPKSVRKRDDAKGELIEAGHISGLGREIRVGLSRNTQRGELEVRVMDDSIDLSALVDPGLKDPVAADNRRIQAALVLSGVSARIEDFAELVSGPIDQVASPETIASNDPVEMADSLRRDLHERARTIESQSEKAKARAVALRDSLGSDPGSALEVRVASERLSAATIQLADLQRQAKERERAKDSRDRAERVLATIVEDDPATIVEQIGDAEKALAALLEQVTERRVYIADAKSRLTAAKQAKETREAAEASLAYFDGLPDPGIRELANADSTVYDAKEAVRLATLAEEYRARAEQSDSAAREAEDLSKMALTYRDAAAGTRIILARLLGRHAPEHLGIYGDRLVVEVDGRRRYFAELSDGERWTIALDLAIEALGDHRILSLAQIAWEGLDGTARAALIAHAKSRKTLIVTAEADHGDIGELRAELA